MDEARCKELSRVVTSEELYIIDKVKSLTYSCDECGIELLPCSFQKNVNLRKPYFKTRKGVHHKQGCDAEGEAKIRSKGASTRLTSSEGFPLAYPNRFKLRKDDVVEPTGVITPLAPDSRHPNKRKKDQSDGSGRKSNYETTSFKSIVNQYFDFPYDRDRALSFEGVDGTTYTEIFSQIRSTRGNQKFVIQGDKQKIYYASLPWKLSIEDNGKIQINLSPGKWVEREGKKVNERPYYVEVDFSNWPQRSKSKFLSDYNKIIELVRGTNRKAAIAFVGEQDTKDDYFRFYSIDRRLITFKVFNDA
ncbi:hypothetical protein [Vibrio metschnikovii]|uniref:hypothetical protein n=1 Tax=Vibrio metschnikovii TaxID=28172 RepID=UPI001C30A2EB|nr:hypothetical protein [Vibrio metschnikovii]